MTFADYSNWVPLLAPVTSGTTVQSFTSPDGEVWVAKNGVNNGNWYRARDVLYARVARASALTSSTSAVLFPWANVTWDPYGIYNGTQFVAPIAGRYLLKASIGITFTAAAQWVLLYLTCPAIGGNSAGVQTVAGGSGTASAVTMDSLKASAGDAFGIFYQTSAALAVWTNSTANSATIDYLGTG